ncbi:hypothetical protein ACWF95_36710 [Streptomyces vinaceus]
MSDLTLRSTERDAMPEVPGGATGPAMRPGSRRSRMARRGLVSAAMVAALVTSGGIASIGESFAADLPVNILCPQVNVCEIFSQGVTPGGSAGVAVDADGNSYVGDVLGNLNKVTPGGQTSQFASFGSTVALRAVAMGADGNIYVGLSGSSIGELWKVTPGGVKTLIANGLGGSGAYGIAVEEDGDILALNANGILLRVTQAGVKTTVATSIGSSTWGIGLDREGNAYISSTGGQLYKVTPAGVKTQITTGLGTAFGVAVDGDANVYVTNQAGVMWRVAPDGSKETVATNIGSGGTNTWGVAFDTNGDAFVTSQSAKNLWRLAGVGVPWTSAPAAPSIAAPKPNGVTGAYPVFKGHALAENGSVDADEVQILDANGVILDTTPVRQSDGYFSWMQNGKWDLGPHTLKFVSIRGDLKSDATVLKFTVAPGPVAPVVTVPEDNKETGPRPKFIGSAPGATMVLVQNLKNQTIGQATVGGDGYFSWIQPGPWAVGPHEIQFVAKNALGLSAPVKKKFVVHIPAPVVTLPVQKSTTGLIPKFAGTAPANSQILFRENGKLLGFTTTKPTGDWSWRLLDEEHEGVWAHWSPGIHNVDVFTSIGGVESPQHTTVTFTVQ